MSRSVLGIGGSHLFLPIKIGLITLGIKGVTNRPENNIQACWAVFQLIRALIRALQTFPAYSWML